MLYFQIARVKSIVLGPYKGNSQERDPDYGSPIDIGKIKYELLYSPLGTSKSQGVSEPAWPIVINNLLLFLGFQEELPIQMSLVIGYIGMPLAFLMWLFAVADLMYKRHRNEIRMISIILATIYQILFSRCGR